MTCSKLTPVLRFSKASSSVNPSLALRQQYSKCLATSSRHVMADAAPKAHALGVSHSNLGVGDFPTLQRAASGARSKMSRDRFASTAWGRAARVFLQLSLSSSRFDQQSESPFAYSCDKAIRYRHTAADLLDDAQNRVFRF
jgi:hypothetical protein